MRIARRPSTLEETDARRRVIAHADAPATGRVCGGHCNAQCGRCGSRGCQCTCSPYCPDAPQSLSSDPMYPLEPKVAPLVYQMKRSGLFEPCWSCEGHESASGQMQKPPTVWFYCSTTALRLLSGGLAKLRLNAPWRIAVTYSDHDNPEPTFALEPQTEGRTLAELQADLAAIAAALPELIRQEARALQAAF